MSECKHMLPEFLCRRCNAAFFAANPPLVSRVHSSPTEIDFVGAEVKIDAVLPEGVKKKVTRYISNKV